jgi:sulfhydrogenase subunit alpha
VVRVVEALQASQEALRLIDAYEPPDAPAVPVEPRAGTGHGWAEAPRGTLYHRYAAAAIGQPPKRRAPSSPTQAVCWTKLPRCAPGRASSSAGSASCARRCGRSRSR